MSLTNYFRRALPAALFLVLLSTFTNSCADATDKTATPQQPSSTSPANPSSANAQRFVVREVESPAGEGSREPDLYTVNDGRVILSWVEKVNEKRHALRFAEREGEGWSETRTVAEGDNWFVNWADFPSVVALPDKKTFAAHWLARSGVGTYAYDVQISLSTDGGRTWARALTPHTDGKRTEHGFVSLFPWSGGRTGAVWLDGRNFKEQEEGKKEAAGHDDEAHGADMTLRFAAIDATGKLSDEAQLDARVCECCQTSGAAISEGALVVYRDRSSEEVRDIYAVRFERGKWSEPRAVSADGWKVSGCPVNGPSVAANGRRAVVAWYTEAGEKPRVQVAFSDDAGATFNEAIGVDDGAGAVGRVDVLLLDDGSALVVWLAGAAEQGEIKARRVHADGARDDAFTVAATSTARSSGFPRMARRGDEIIFAWTQFGKPSRVKTAVARLER